MASPLIGTACRSWRRSAARLLAISRQMASSAAPEIEPSVLVSSTNACRTVTLNRPRALNALDLDMVRVLTPQFKAWENDNNIAVIVIKGSGEKAFCAGGDVVAVAKSGRGGDDDGAFARDFFREEYILNHLLARLKIPFVAVVDGICMGGGVGLSLPAKFRVATERTLFAMPETAIGLFPDVGGSFYLPRLSGSLGMYLALTGARLKGEDVLKAGVATHFITSDKLSELESGLADISCADADEVQSVLDGLDSRSDAPPSFAPHEESINECFSAESIEEILEKLNSSSDEWCSKQAATINKMSPTSLKITHKQLTLGATMSLEECLRMEYRMTQGCMRENDFYEGIRAVLIDRDHSPKWSPDTLEGVSTELVESHFTQLQNDLYLD